jgi:hypothetical protein
MAKEKKHESSGGKGKKKHLKAITTHKADDGSFVHEHKYQDEDGNESSSYGGVSSDLADLQQHMSDHFGPDAGQGDGQPPQADGADAGAAQPAAGPAPAQAQ